MKILNDVDEKLLSRRSLTILVDHSFKATPKKEELKKQLAQGLKVDEKLIVIKHIYSNYGQGSSKVIVHIYKNEKDLNDIEIKKKKKKKKDGKKEETKKQEAK